MGKGRTVDAAGPCLCRSGVTAEPSAMREGDGGDAQACKRQGDQHGRVPRDPHRISRLCRGHRRARGRVFVDNDPASGRLINSEDALEARLRVQRDF